MATSPGFAEFVTDLLSPLGEISHRKMF